MLEAESTSFKNGPGPMDLVYSFARAKLLHQAVGASPYGGDLNKWPARLVDAFSIFQEEQNHVDALRESSSASLALQQMQTRKS